MVGRRRWMVERWRIQRRRRELWRRRGKREMVMRGHPLTLEAMNRAGCHAEAAAAIRAMKRT